MSAAREAAETRIEQVTRILRTGPICEECLGRAYGKLGRGLSNPERGAAFVTAAAMLGERPKEGACWVCGDVFSEADAWAKRAAALVDGAEFESYVFGVRLSPRLAEMESYFAERFPTRAIESMKHAFNRTVGLCFNRLFPDTTVAFQEAEVSFLIDLTENTITEQIASVYVFGRYRKLVRGIPQTKWPCRRCGGRGCEACGQSGKQYPESVEEWVAGPLVEAAKGSGARFHGAGREDIDALMLGQGRPFVLEILSPRVRSLNLTDLCDEVNRRAAGRVGVTDFAFVGRRAVESVKESRVGKRYRALVAFDGDVTAEAFEESLGFLVGTITQQTPQRVAHRRADKVRMRTLYAAEGRLIDSSTAEVEFTTEGGLYVKELVSGDDERTEPSLAGRLDVGARVTELDVVEVMWPTRENGAVDIPFELP